MVGRGYVYISQKQGVGDGLKRDFLYLILFHAITDEAARSNSFSCLSIIPNYRLSRLILFQQVQRMKLVEIP